MSWVFPDSATRRDHLVTLFGQLARDFLPDRGTVHLLDDASVSFWRGPDFDEPSTAADRAEAVDGSAAEGPFPPDAMERLAILGAAMKEAHPHETHWYLNVLSTIPERQGQGLGGRVLQPVLAVCDRDGIPAYLESSNPRNITLYRRAGFSETGEIKLPDGPSLHAMWREPRR